MPAFSRLLEISRTSPAVRGVPGNMVVRLTYSSLRASWSVSLSGSTTPSQRIPSRVGGAASLFVRPRIG